MTRTQGRWLSLMLGAALTAGALVSSAAAKDLTITTWTATSPGLQDWWKVLEQKFEASHPGVDVKVENVAFGDYIRTLTTRLVAGSPPTLIHVPLPTINLPAWAGAGFLDPVDKKITGTDIATKWPPNQAAMAWNGVNYGVLLVQYGYNFFVNERMLKEAGVVVPKTKEELLAAAKTLTKNGKYGFAIADDNTANFMSDALVFVTGNGGHWVKDGKWNFTDPKVVEALNLWRDLTLNCSPRGTNVNAKRQAFYDGNVAMMIENPSVWPNVATAAKPEIVSSLHLAPMPFEYVPGNVSHGFSIPSELKDADKALAWEFVIMSSSPDMMRSYVDLVKSPVARPGVDEPLKATPDTAIIAEAGAKAVAIIPNDYYGVREKYADFSTLVTNSLRSILQGASTQEALRSLEASLSRQGIKPL